VVECAVVGLDDSTKGQVPLALVVLGQGTRLNLHGHLYVGESVLFKQELRDKIVIYSKVLLIM
jgi:acyl-coenzyme A synthetase/AMP-(fatty) acid ligase